MKQLVHLDQLIELERGEAGQLCWEISSVLRGAALRAALEPPRRLEARLVLALPVLHRVARRLYSLAQREAAAVGPPSRRPRRFRLTAEEVVAIMLHVYPVATGSWVELGKVQQKALNLEPFIAWP